MQIDIIGAVTCLSANVARFARVDPPAHASRSRCSPRDGAHSYEIHGTQKRVPPKHRDYSALCINYSDRIAVRDYA